MNNFRYLLLVMVSVLSVLGSGISRADEQPEEKTIPIKAAFIPVGFDNNDQVQVVVAGFLPDSCHQVGPTKVSIDNKKATITLEQIAYDYTQIRKLCVQMVTPFTQVVELGILSKPEQYTILGVEKQATRTLGKLGITLAPHPEKVDENIYMPTTNAHIKEGNDGKFSLVLEAQYSDKCMAYQDTQFKTFPGQPVLIALPTMKKVGKEGEPCNSTEADIKKFTVEKEINQKLIGTYLVHIRTFQGKSLNIFQAFSKTKTLPH